jgi:hypothetical protein
MGAKYMPTDRDVKATKRYQENLARLAREKKLAAVPRPGIEGKR